MSQSDLVNTSPLRRWFPRVSRKQWLSAAAVCFIGAAYLFSYEKWPVTVTAETPLYVASRDGKQGVVTSGGRIVVPFEWEEIGEFDDQGMAVAVKSSESIHLNSANLVQDSLKTEVTGVIDRTGRMIIPAELTERPKGFDGHDHYVGQSGHRLVIYDRSGQQLMKPEWELLGELSFDSHGLLPARNGSEVGWIDRDGNLKVRAPDGLTPISGFGTNSLAVVKDEENLEGCVNLQGEVVIAPFWENINVTGYSYTGDDGERRRDDNLIAVTGKNPSSRLSGTSKGYLRKNGDVVVAADYDVIMLDLSRKTATVLEVSEKWGVLDFHGNVIVPFEYDDLSLHDETGLAAAHQDSKWGWINQKGEIAIPFEFDDYSRQNLSRPFNQRGLATVRKGDQWGAIDSAGKVVVPFEYSGAKHCGLQDDWLGFRQSGRWGCIDYHGNVVVPFEYDAPVMFEIETLATLRKGSWFHAMDRSGRVHQKRTQCELRTLVDDLEISDWRKSMDTYNRLVAGEFLAAVELDSSLTGVGHGIFSTERGMIVPPIHSHMLITQYGFRGDGCGRKPAGVFEKLSAVPRQLLERIIGPIARPEDKLQVLYDFQGKEIWRSDARYRDLLKAWSLLFAGVGCVVCWRWARRSKAIAS